jgi:hypothetical protein
VRLRIFRIVIVIVVASGWSFSQNVEPRAPAMPRIILNVPDNLPSGVNWIRYSLSGSVSTGAMIKVDPKLRQYVIDAMIGDTPASKPKSSCMRQDANSMFTTSTLQALPTRL